MADRENATPTQLAEEIAKVIDLADADTAFTALDIARLLIQHREGARINFEHQCAGDELRSKFS